MDSPEYYLKMDRSNIDILGVCPEGGGGGGGVAALGYSWTCSCIPPCIFCL